MQVVSLAERQAASHLAKQCGSEPRASKQARQSIGGQAVHIAASKAEGQGVRVRSRAGWPGSAAVSQARGKPARQRARQCGSKTGRAAIK